MPTYQYACTECGEPLEAVQSFTDAPLTECPACSGRLRKVFSAVGVVFKGSGFYKTDSRSAKGSGEGAAKKDGGAKTDAPATTAGKSEGSGGSGGSGADKAAAKPASTSSAPVAKSA